MGLIFSKSQNNLERRENFSFFIFITLSGCFSYTQMICICFLCCISLLKKDTRRRFRPCADLKGFRLLAAEELEEISRRTDFRNWWIQYRKPAKKAFKEMNKSFNLNEDGGLFSSANYSNMGRNSQKQLTEIEKERRSLRRILANRESARGAILRRQAKLTELARLSADLEMQNENLKRERELAASEYNLLKRTNENLKAQIDDEMMKSEAMLMKKKKSITVVSNQSSSGLNRESFPQDLNGSIEKLGSENDGSTILPLSQMWMPNVDHHLGAFVYVLPLPLLYTFTAPTSTQHLVQTTQPNESLVHEFGLSCPIEKRANDQPSLPLKSELGPSIFAGQEAGSISSVVDGESSVITASEARKRRKEMMRLKYFRT